MIRALPLITSFVQCKFKLIEFLKKISNTQIFKRLRMPIFLFILKEYWEEYYMCLMFPSPIHIGHKNIKQYNRL